MTGTMPCLQEGGKTELLPGKSRVAASLKCPAHASRGVRRGTELGGAWVFVFSLQSACQTHPPPGRTGWTDGRGWAEQCLWWASGSSLCFDKPSSISADSRGHRLSVLTKQRLQFDPLPGLLSPLTKSLPQLLHILILAAKPPTPLLWHRDSVLPSGQSPPCPPCSC